MASNSFGRVFRVTTFGESHGPAIGGVVDGLPAGKIIDLQLIQQDLDRRRPGQSSVSTARKEADQLEVLSGLFDGKTTGAPFSFMVRNRDARSLDYDLLKDVFRPGHADFTWQHKYGLRDHRGGGRASGRETVARVVAGSVAKQLLAPLGVSIFAHVVQIGSLKANRFERDEIERNPVRCADREVASLMVKAIEEIKHQGDSLGGIVEIRAVGVPLGWGDPVFDKLDAQLGLALLSIGAVKGVEIGAGFALAALQGCEANDALLPSGFASNHMGGILGGISTGQELVVRVVVKPTSSISRSQQTIDRQGQPITLEVPGRHDPCICPRVVPVAEAMLAIVLCDAWLCQQALVGQNENLKQGEEQ